MSLQKLRKKFEKIHNAKAAAEKESRTKIIYESIGQLQIIDVDKKLYTTLLKAYQKQKIKYLLVLHG